jgi:hypothetical protein
MPRGRPRKIIPVEVPASPESKDPHDSILHPRGGRFDVGSTAAWTCGHELYTFYVRRRDVVESGRVWLYGSSAYDSNEITMIVPEDECRRRRAPGI